MKICFAIPDIANLRYYGPIIEFLKEEQNIDINLCVRKDSVKYCGLKSEKNYNIFKKIVSSYFEPSKIIPMSKSKMKCDILFSVENVDNNRFDYEKHYVIQHGFDYNIHGKNSDSKTTYISHSELYQLDIQSKFNRKAIVPPIPIAFSHIKRNIQFAKKQINTHKDIAFIFYPYKGNHALTRKIITYLKNKNFFVITKQKRKYQSIPPKSGADLIVYDDIWYPSENVFYPLISKLVIGFASSAFMELCEVGIPYIDIAISKLYRKDTKFYLKPNLKNFWYLEKKFYKNTINAINHISSEEQDIKIIPEFKLKEFYIELLNY